MARAAALVLALALVPASDAVAQAGRVETGRLSVAGSERTWRIFAPAARAARAPVVVVLHGGGDTTAAMARGTRFDAAAAAHGFIAVYPQARGTRFNAGICCSDTSGDVALVERLVDRVVTKFGGDPRRVFAAGFSNGGFMAYRLACQRSALVAGIAAVAATELTVPCRPRHPVSVLHIQARDETRVPFAGGRWREHPNAPRGYRGSPGAFDLARRWRARNRCRPGTRVMRTASLAVWDTASCAGRTRVRLVVPAVGGHRWFGGEPPYGSPSDAIDATSEIAAFFARLPTRPRVRRPG